MIPDNHPENILLPFTFLTSVYSADKLLVAVPDILALRELAEVMLCISVAFLMPVYQLQTLEAVQGDEVIRG